MLTDKLKKELLFIQDDYARSLKLVEYLFKDKTDREGKPYINHLLRVSEKLDNPNTKVAGLLHDSVEDIEGFTLETLKELNFNDEIINLVASVTNKPSETYHDKITSIIESNNIELIKLKYADMSDNYNLERMKDLSQDQKDYLINKYKDEYPRLENRLKELLAKGEQNNE